MGRKDFTTARAFQRDCYLCRKHGFPVPHEPRHSAVKARLLPFLMLALCALLPQPALAAVALQGKPIQGGLLFGQAQPGSHASLDGQAVIVSAQGAFVIGFDRDETGQKILKVAAPDGQVEQIRLDVARRKYDIERVDGLPPATVEPDPAALQRIRDEAAMVSAARSRRDNRTDYAAGFSWPASGRISGVYGSQRILNGEPGRPHYGVDIAAAEGSPVYAPADGIITLAHPGMYFSGGTIILDHGQGLSSTFLHLSKLLVESGMTVHKGDLIARVGATGRASGPHLDWRMNWLDRRVDPQLLFESGP
jgi:murein DD-endopeptidase MepM/ murein hydrolase activator NlpD